MDLTENILYALDKILWNSVLKGNSMEALSTSP